MFGVARGGGVSQILVRVAKFEFGVGVAVIEVAGWMDKLWEGWQRGGCHSVRLKESIQADLG